MHVIVWKDFSPSHLHLVLLRKCQQGEGTELFSYGAGRSWDWKTAISSSPTSPSQQNVKVHSLLWEDSSPQGLPQEKICSGVKIHTFSNCHWHFSTAAIMLLTWRWLFQVKEFASKQSLCSGSEENGVPVWKGNTSCWFVFVSFSSEHLNNCTDAEQK